jgi:ubiquinone/menaquinone biosynthesis C-methylase UbiE
MTSVTSELAKKYGDSRKLAARAGVNSKHAIAEVGWFQWIARQLPLHAGDRVLDIGCGPDWFWEAVVSVLPERLNLTLADRSPGMVQEAVERCQTFPFGSVQGQQADATALLSKEGSFDTVIAMHMLYHLPDPAKGIAEIYRSQKPGGFLAVTTSGARNMRKMYELTVFGSPPSDPAAAAFGSTRPTD